ncbi:MAG: hypothetical protein CMI26_08360 [Opitutae bacterium]|nr:hypothetical protein [Opitutae bacterium]
MPAPLTCIYTRRVGKKQRASHVAGAGANGNKAEPGRLDDVSNNKNSSADEAKPRARVHFGHHHPKGAGSVRRAA